METGSYIYDEDIRSIESIDISVLSNDEILRMSALGKDSIGIDIPDLYDNMEPKRGGLIDTRMGTTNNDTDCSTCGLSSTYCVGHFAHISLAEPIFHMGYIHFVKKILSCICLKCSKLLVYKNEDELADMLKHKSGRARFSDIRNIAKNVTYCQKPNYGCGTPVSKIKLEVKKSTATVLMYSETNLTNMPTEEGTYEGKKKIRQILTPEICYDILKNISDVDCMIMGIDPKKTRPEDMIIKIFPVPPVAVRPSTKADFLASSTMEDDLTHKLADIIKCNVRIRRYKEAANEGKHTQDNAILLQYHGSTYIDNESLSLPKAEQRGKQTKSLNSRLKGKEGRIRGNLMGKRVDFSARTVITPDPTIDINEMGVPKKVAMNLTFPEVVTQQNIDRLQQLVKNGRYKYPGANFVFPASSMEKGRKLHQIDLRYRKDKVDLRYGDVVERHIVTGDIVLLNRQPTLHKLSMMGHRIKVLENDDLSTFRLNVAVTTPYNADFDGDEMNIFLPQSEQAMIELEEIADVKRQIITPRTSTPIIGIKQDGLLGAYNLTSPNMKIDWKDVMNIISYTTIDDFDAFKKDKEYDGSEIYSLIIPTNINTKNAGLEIENGLIKKGHILDAHLASQKANSLIHLIWDEYGMNETKTFLDNTQRLANNFNLLNGFTVGIKDLTISDSVYDQKNKLFQTKMLETDHQVTEMENNPDFLDENLFEDTVNSSLNTIRSDVSKLVINNLSADNKFKIMMLCGSKGKEDNIGQMIGCVGQQAVEGKRIRKRINGRSLPYFHQNDDSAKARGFIPESFLEGTHPISFIFHNMASREGLIDTAIKTAESGYVQRKLIKSLEDAMINYDGTVRNANQKILQFIYGDDGVDTTKQSRHDMKLLKMGNKEIAEKYKFTEAELNKYKKFSSKENEDYYKFLLSMRDDLRESRMRISTNYIVLDSNYMIPVNIARIINNVKSMKMDDDKKVDLEPEYVFNRLENILEYDRTKIMCLSEQDTKDSNSIKFRDEQRAKTVFKFALHENLAPKICIKEHELTKAKFDMICDRIIVSFNKAIVEPGEMIGIIAAQSIGEPVTQMTLNSVDWADKIVVFEDGKMNITAIGKYIDDKIETGVGVQRLGDNHENEMGDTFYVDISDQDVKTVSVNKDGKLSWNNITALTKHLPINKDGTDDLVKITTRLGRSVTATKAKSFLTRIDNEVVPIRGDEIKVGTMVPVAMNYPVIEKEITHLDISKYFDSDTIIPKMIPLDEDFGFFVGTYLAKGLVTKTDVCISNNNEVYLNRVIRFCNAYKIGYDIHTPVDKVQCGRTSIDVMIHSVILVKLLGEICGIGSEHKYIDSWIYQSPAIFRKGLLDGYFSCDNSVNESEKGQNEMFCSSISENLIDGLVMLLSQFNIIAKKSKPTLIKENSHESQDIKQHYTLAIPNGNIKWFDDKAGSAKIVQREFRCENDIYDIIPGNNLKCIRGDVHRRDIETALKSKIDHKDKAILEKIVNSDVYYDEIISIETVKPSHKYVYDLTVEEDKTFVIHSGIGCFDTFHHAGIGAKGTASLGVPRVKELLHFSKNIKTPRMYVYLEPDIRGNMSLANKIASHIKHTTISEIRDKVEIYYDPQPQASGGFMEQDNVYNIFYSHNPSKYSCQPDVNSLPWLMRIVLNKERMLNKDITLLDIKAKYCNHWEKRYRDARGLKKEEKQLLDKITQTAILSNHDNDKLPILHIRFDMTDFDFATIVGFLDTFIDNFKLKGIDNIDKILDTSETRMVSFDNEDQAVSNDKEFITVTSGVNLIDLCYVNGVDVNRTICNDVVEIYEHFGIEAARAALLKEISTVFSSSGNNVNYSHLSILIDTMTSNGTLTSIDRHGMGKLDTDPLARASFEKTVDQLIQAAVFSEQDHMKSVSSRIMAGMVIKGGTGLCNVILNTKMLENSEYIEDLETKYKKTFTELTSNPVITDVLDKEEPDIFLPDF
jgi:DNA-directed RNA polymerase II subunit RPB1